MTQGEAAPHLPGPSCGSPQLSAIKRASATPSSLRKRGNALTYTISK